MAGTKEGGRKAAKANKRKYGENYYATVGSKGGKVKFPGKGFASRTKGSDGLTGHQRAERAGRIGGMNGRHR